MGLSQIQSRNIGASKVGTERVDDIIEGACHCGKIVSPMEDGTFRCDHCVHFIHIACTKKNMHSTSQCLACHMRHLIPNKPVVKQLFTGLLQKTKRKHEITFTI